MSRIITLSEIEAGFKVLTLKVDELCDHALLRSSEYNKYHTYFRISQLLIGAKRSSWAFKWSESSH